MTDTNSMPERVCEVCGERAVKWSGNLREIDPEVDEDGVAWQRWERDDPPGHWRCAKHPRSPRVVMLDGTVEGGKEQSPAGKAWAKATKGT